MNQVRVGYPRKGWTKVLIEGWNKASTTTASEVILDLSKTEFVTLYDWVTVVAMIEKVLSNPNVKSFKIDTKGDDPANFVPLGEFIDIDKGRPTKRFIPDNEVALSKRIYRTVGFIESLGTLDILNRRSEDGKVSYPEIKVEDVRSHQFYSREKGDIGVLLGLTRIYNKEDCKKFLDKDNIINWVQAMVGRFPDSPLFETEEIWRVLCHEFAVNIFEHARISGFISMRVVAPKDGKGNIHSWCRQTYPSLFLNRLKYSKNSHFLELCIGDAGRGIVKSLKKSYIDRINQEISSSQKNTHIEDINSKDVLAFAFDELGTCKSGEECWLTERHALNRILHIVAKYEGHLVVNSGGVELIFSSTGEKFKKKRTGSGYEPTDEKEMPGILPGVHFQLLLPLIPQTGGRARERKSVLGSALPTTFQTEQEHVRGHLVPLLEKLDQPGPCVGKAEHLKFRKACENLSKELFERASSEPFVLDFSQLNWKAEQFETLLHFLQNIIQHRPVLLVEISPALAQDVVLLESMAAPTKLDKKMIYQHLKKGSPFFDDLSEKTFLETYNRIHATVLGIDKDGQYYIFGLRDHAYEDALLSLIETPKSVEELCGETIWEKTLKASPLKAVLNGINPMFEKNDRNQWSTVWGPRELQNEVKRVMSRHFDKVADRSSAWRGFPYKNRGVLEGRNKYKLPWQREWRTNFLEGTRILSRERHGDEIAQRLIYRLQKGLELKKKSLSDVKVLACVTAPGMLLASFIHRWWPPQYDRPAVSDLGYYIMFSHPKDLPVIVKSGGVVVVQDILDNETISGKLCKTLRQQELEILCVLSFIKMVPSVPETTVTPLEMGWGPSNTVNMEDSTPKHSMVLVKSPESCDPPLPHETDKNTFWIEPRTLRPVRYTSLRRQFALGRDPDLERRNKYLKRFDGSDSGCLFSAGHFVYGHRHFLVGLDVQKVLSGDIGDEIALWLADICENFSGRKPEEWESERGHQLNGDVSTVLMPLHSQIHYIWPKVEKILAQRGRRQPSWFLDATLFVGSGPAYGIPDQFRFQIRVAVNESIDAKNRGKTSIDNPIRILILDDAIVTARTADTILGKISRTVKSEFSRRGISHNLIEYPNPIEWIRYFCFLNQMSQMRHLLWKDLRSIGETETTFVFEQYAPFMGVPVYNDTDCPICRDIERIKRLGTICEQYGFDSAHQWIEKRLTALQPVAVDSPGFNRAGTIYLKNGIEVLRQKSIQGMDTSSKYYPVHAATAIWKFNELMYYSYPPSDILQCLENAWGKDDDGIEEKRDYERYRWAVLEWCIGNWKRLEANAAINDFIQEVIREINHDSPLVQPLLEGCSQHFESIEVINLIAYCIETLAGLELKRATSDEGAEPERIQRTTNLYTALILFWLNIPRSAWDKLYYTSPNHTEEISLIKHIDNVSKGLDVHGPCFLRNFCRQLMRPQRHTDPKWALDTIAESLLRGRDPQYSRHGRHYLLPKLISKILAGGSDNEDRLLLQSSLTLFIAAIEEILHFDYQLSFDTYEVKALSREVLKWLKFPAGCKEGRKIPPELRELRDTLDLDSAFMKKFNCTFHEEVEMLRKFLESEASDKGRGQLDFVYRPAPDIARCRILIPGHRFRICLSNYAIDPIKGKRGEHKSRIEVFRISNEQGKEEICFRLLTNFDTLEETRRLTASGQHIKADQYRLEVFGAKFDKEWQEPSASQKEEGFTASYKIIVPSGFMPGGKK